MTEKHKDASEPSSRWNAALDMFYGGAEKEALPEFYRLADEGYSDAMVMIGNCYENGRAGIEKNLDKAGHWYQSAFNTDDNPIAYLGIGRVYLTLEPGNLEHCNKAKIIFEQIDNEFDSMGAKYALGSIWRHGYCGEKDPEKARSYFLASKEQGHLLAESSLAFMALERSKVLGAALWLKATFKVFIAMYRNPHDPRLSVSIFNTAGDEASRAETGND